MDDEQEKHSRDDLLVSSAFADDRPSTSKEQTAFIKYRLVRELTAKVLCPSTHQQGEPQPADGQFNSFEHLSDDVQHVARDRDAEDLGSVGTPRVAPVDLEQQKRWQEELGLRENATISRLRGELYEHSQKIKEMLDLTEHQQLQLEQLESTVQALQEENTMLREANASLQTPKSSYKWTCCFSGM